MSIQEILNKKPSRQCHLTTHWRKTYNYMDGTCGNILLQSEDRCIGNIELENKVWLYSDGTKCYINLSTLKLQPFYSPVLTMGRYVSFYKNQTNDVVEKMKNWVGSIEKEVAQAVGNYYRQLYVIDMQSAMLYMVDEEYMIKALQQNPDLLAKFKKELEAQPIVSEAKANIKGDGYGDLYARYLQYLNG